MMKGRHIRHRRGPLMLLALGVMITSTANADESFLMKPNITDLEDGDITLARAKHGGTGVYMSFMLPTQMDENSQTDFTATEYTGLVPDVFLSLRMSW